MTREKAIEILQEIRAAFKSWSGFVEYPQAIDMAIEALKREIPKNPVINFVADSDGARRLNEGWTDDALLCPVCHSYVGDVFDELYCSKCGQKIVQKRVRLIV